MKVLRDITKQLFGKKRVSRGDLGIIDGVATNNSGSISEPADIAMVSTGYEDEGKGSPIKRPFVKR